MATRKENAEKLEAMATKGPRLSGLKNMKTSSKIALAILVVVVLLSVLASVLAPYDPYAIDMARQRPTPPTSSAPTTRVATSCRASSTAAASRSSSALAPWRSHS